jgi:uncharacterized membrane protein (Fun14 family)
MIVCEALAALSIISRVVGIALLSTQEKRLTPAGSISLQQNQLDGLVEVSVFRTVAFVRVTSAITIESVMESVEE